MITDSFSHNGQSLQVRLITDGDSFVVYARHEGGGCLNGFEFRVHNITGKRPDEVFDHPVFVHLRTLAKQLAVSDAWTAYEKAYPGNLPSQPKMSDEDAGLLCGRMYEAVDIQRYIESGDLKSMTDVLEYAKATAGACNTELKQAGKLAQTKPISKEKFRLLWEMTPGPADIDKDSPPYSESN